MKKIKFQFTPWNLSSTARHLSRRGDFPGRADDIKVIEGELVQAVVKRFGETYRGRRLHRGDLGDGILRVPVLWRGIGCTFHTSRSSGKSAFAFPVEIDQVSEVDEVDVTLHVTPGRHAPYTVDRFRLEQFIERVESAVTSNDKGDALERLAGYVFSGVPGFRVLDSNRHTASEEIDLVIENRSKTFSREEYYVLVECKNWTGRSGKNELVVFRDKMMNRRRRCSLGFFLSWNGFTSTTDIDQVRHSRSKLVIACLTSNDIREMLVREPVEVLQDAVHKQVFT